MFIESTPSVIAATIVAVSAVAYLVSWTPYFNGGRRSKTCKAIFAWVFWTSLVILLVIGFQVPWWAIAIVATAFCIGVIVGCYLKKTDSETNRKRKKT